MSDTDTSHPDVPQAQPTPDDYAANLPGLLNYFSSESGVGDSYVVRTVKAAVRRAIHAESENTRLRNLLLSLEWINDGNPSAPEVYYCPVCKRWREDPKGHQEGCELGKLTGEGVRG